MQSFYTLCVWKHVTLLGKKHTQVTSNSERIWQWQVLLQHITCDNHLCANQIESEAVCNKRGKIMIFQLIQSTQLISMLHDGCYQKWNLAKIDKSQLLEKLLSSNDIMWYDKWGRGCELGKWDELCRSHVLILWWSIRQWTNLHSCHQANTFWWW